MVNSFPPERGRRFEFYRSVTRSDAQAHALRDQPLRQFDIAGRRSGLDVEGSNGNLVVD
jgi:hypothetical protein